MASNPHAGKSWEFLRRSRSAISGTITKNGARVEAIDSKDKADVSKSDVDYLEALQERLERSLDDARFLNAAILEKCPHDDNEMENEINSAEEFEERIHCQLKAVERILSQFDEPDAALAAAIAAPVVSTPSTITSTIKMPKFNLPKFNGNYKEWIPFREQFCASVDRNATLPDIQKFNYLKSSLTGEPLKLVAHLPLSNSNYPIALKSLRDRYDNPRVIINSHVDVILKLKAIEKESTAELRKLLSSFDENLMAIGALRTDVTKSDFLLVKILAEKLDKESRRQWELEHPGTALQTLDQLRAFITTRAQALESVQSDRQDRTTSNKGHVDKQPKQSSQVYSSGSHKPETCPQCSEQHPIFHCSTFKGLDIGKRSEICKEKSLCFNCLRAGHSSRECKSNSTCRTCQKRHRTLLHRPQGTSSLLSSTQSTQGHQAGSSFTSTLLPTAMVEIKTDSNKFLSFRALLDSGSQLTCITEKCRKRLGLKPRQADVEISGIGGNFSTRSASIVHLEIVSSHQRPIQTTAVVLEKVTKLLPSQRITGLDNKQLKDLPLADPTFAHPGEVDIIIGADIIEQVMDNHKRAISNELFARKTVFGWVLCGKVPMRLINHSNVFHVSHITLDEQLKKFWELEEVPKIKHWSKEEEMCEQHFQQNFKVEHNRFVVGLPFKNEVVLGDSFDQAKRRFSYLQRRLSQKPDLKKKYSEFIEEFKNMDHIEEVPAAQEITPRVKATTYHTIVCSRKILRPQN